MLTYSEHPNISHATRNFSITKQKIHLVAKELNANFETRVRVPLHLLNDPLSYRIHLRQSTPPDRNFHNNPQQFRGERVFRQCAVSTAKGKSLYSHEKRFENDC